jgi:hypothetical protein
LVVCLSSLVQFLSLFSALPSLSHRPGVSRSRIQSRPHSRLLRNGLERKRGGRGIACINWKRVRRRRRRKGGPSNFMPRGNLIVQQHCKRVRFVFVLRQFWTYIDANCGLKPPTT